MGLSTPDPSIPLEPYDPDKPNPGIREILRQQEFNEKPDWVRAMGEIQKAQGMVYENGGWVKNVPYSSATCGPEGA